MSDELKPCPFCGNEPAPYWKGVGCATSGCLLNGLHLDADKWNRRAQPAEAEGVDRQRMIESMCLTWRHDFGLDKPADCQLSSGMTDTERNQLRDQMGKLFDHHFAPALSAVTAEVEALPKDAERWRAFRKAGLPNGLGVYDAELDAACDELIEEQREDA